MSGGYLERVEWQLDDVLEQIQAAIKEGQYSEATYDKMKVTMRFAAITRKMIHRVDYLLAGDDSEETFHEHWNKEVIH